MPHSFDEIRQLAHTLPEAQRIELANSLYESVEPAEVEADWNDEIVRRLDEIESGAVQTIPGERVMARLLGRMTPEARARIGK